LAFDEWRSYFISSQIPGFKNQIPWRKKKMKKNVFNSVGSRDGFTFVLKSLMVTSEDGRTAS